ncbi:MAG: nuclear transport factor 2 family protein [Rhodobacteraceae bacterium]|nr:nuclear transport factor 2 family protein [Paracoccaceae bacterium]
MQEGQRIVTEIQSAKNLVRAYQTDLEHASADTAEAALASYLTPDTFWRGMHPFHERTGPADIAQAFWTPLKNALTSLQRREDIFFAGLNEVDGFSGVWVASMGHFMGLFDAPFCGIRPTRRIAMVRYAEFCKVENGKITEQAMFVDLLHLMAQTDQYPLPGMTGAMLIQPGPRTHDGLLHRTQPDGEAEGRKTLALIGAMGQSIKDASTGQALAPEEELAQHWHDDMLWWGPAGIGATHTIKRYIEQHQRPFRTKLSNRRFNGHLARIGEGNYGGFFGWPNLTLHVSGDYLGLPATDMDADMRVVDIYRRAGDKLAENWIFIDILHFLNQQGRDILGDLKSQAG